MITNRLQQQSSAAPPVPRLPIGSIHDPTPASGDDSDGREMTARELAVAIGAVELAVLQRHHNQLVVAVADLASASGRNWPYGHDDPTVAMLRALAKLAIDAPDASSGHATALHRAVQDALS